MAGARIDLAALLPSGHGRLTDTDRLPRANQRAGSRSVDRYHHSDGVLPHLRAWMSMVRVSTIIVGVCAGMPRHLRRMLRLRGRNDPRQRFRLTCLPQVWPVVAVDPPVCAARRNFSTSSSHASRALGVRSRKASRCQRSASLQLPHSSTTCALSVGLICVIVLLRVKT